MSLPLVCVTGGTGFLGGHVVADLLRHGYTVRTTVRDPASRKAQFLRDLPAALGLPAESLTLFKADLEDAASFDTAFAGCQAVLHTAAVVKDNFEKDPHTEIINPTVNGVKNVVAACQRAGVRRIVYTSSVATVIRKESLREPSMQGKPFVEGEWALDTTLTPTYGTYPLSKILAEKALLEAWTGEVVSILPGFILGPQMNEDITSSAQVIRLLVNREYPVCPCLYFDWVDVRDVAKAHRLALERTDVTRGRYMCTNSQVVDVADFAKSINKQFPEMKCPTTVTPWGMLWLMSCCDSRISPYFLDVTSQKCQPQDNSLLKRDLGMVFEHTDLDASMKATVDSFKHYGIYKSK